jgi:hypothetical protein
MKKNYYKYFYFRLYTLSNDVNVFTGDVEGNFDARNQTQLTIAVDEFYDRLETVSLFRNSFNSMSN